MSPKNVDFNSIERKWQKKWQKEKVFEANPDRRKKFFVNAPYPYMNAVPHIGHLYTYMRIEALARYKRLNGYNVLFPQGWHCTGSPIVAAAKRVEEGEEKQIEQLKNQGFDKKIIEKLKDPQEWTKIFPKFWEKAFKDIGISYDSRRSFITTELNPYYDKFVRWQFNKLKEKGYVVKGEHPVVWDPKTNMPVGDHDRIQGEGVVPQEFCLFKFSLEDGRKLVSATLRPDTVKGITNLYINPDFTYSVVEVNDEVWIIGEIIVEKLRNQGFNVSVVESVKGSDFVGENVEFLENQRIPVLPASFVDFNYGTGIVHSVPSDSADDLIALRDLQNNNELIKKYSLNKNEVKNIKPIEVFKTPGIKGFAAEYFLEQYKVKSQDERDKLEKIKKELYKLTFNKSVFGHLYSKGFSKNLEGMPVSEGQEIIKKDLIKQGKIDLYYELHEKVVSRSLTECIVKIVKDQWFIKYGDERWKKEVHKALKQMELYPDSSREQFSYTIDWLNDWACTREYGLGTRLPFDEDWLIESLSDSTIYMAFYTISHLIEEIPLGKIDNLFFDYVFLNGKEKPKIKDIEKLKKEFEYWYPFDVRNSGKDLIQNHLTFCLFNHVAIFQKKHWPKSFGVNGWVRVEGQKMSKSLGNMIPVTEMVGKFGADISRLTILNGGEELDDPNWDSGFAQNMKSKLNNFYEFVTKNYGKGRKSRNNADLWAESELNKIIKETSELMEKTLFRSSIQRGYFDLQNVIKRYFLKGEPNKEILKKLIEYQIIILSPFTPFICEEIWEKIGKKGFVSFANWPKIDLGKINEKVLEDESKIDRVQKDIIHIKSLLGKTKDHVYVYPITPEVDLLKENEGFLASTTGSKSVKIFSPQDIKKNPSLDPEGKLKKAKPGKPGIYLK